MKQFIQQIPIIGRLAQRAYWVLFAPKASTDPFPGSRDYWERRYANGGNSGVGSYAQFAEFKAEILNRFVAAHHVQTVIEFGCGDGNQLSLGQYQEYLGIDVSPTAIDACRQRFDGDTTKSFLLSSDYARQTAELSISLDVIYHLVEDNVFDEYMNTVFDASDRFVIIYASDTDDNRSHGDSHVRHRSFTRWIGENRAGWHLIEHIPNRYPYLGDYRTGSFADFFVFERAGGKRSTFPGA